jgi:hypothetical protein
VASTERAPESADQVGALDRRRQLAVEEALSDAQAAASDRGPEVLAVGLRCFSRGRLAVALVGTPDDDGLARLYALTRHLRDLAGTELVVHLAGFRGCSRSLLRLLHQMRGGRGRAGARCELVGCSPADSATDTVISRRR